MTIVEPPGDPSASNGLASRRTMTAHSSNALAPHARACMRARRPSQFGEWRTTGSARRACVTANASVIGPANVRPMLAEAAAENAEQLKASLLEAAGSAVHQVWVTVECSNCGERSRVEAPVPDVRARVAAIELLLREGLGRPPQAEETPAPRLPSSAEAVEKMSWAEMKAVFAALFVIEIDELARSGGTTLVRDRVARLSEDVRNALREALAEPELV